MTLKFTRDWTHSLNNDRVENKKLQNHTKTQQSIEHYQWKDVLVKSFCHFSPPPPHFRRIRGTFAHSSSPEPPYLVENIPPRSRQLVTIAFYKTHTFPGFSREIFSRQTPQTYTPFPEKMGTHMRPLSVFEWGGGGGGGGTSKSLGVQNRLFMSEIGYIRLVYSSSIVKHYPLRLISRGNKEFEALDVVKSPKFLFISGLRR